MTDRSPLATREFVGFAFALLDLDDTVEWTLHRAREDRFAYLVTPNVDHVVQVSQAPTLRPYYEQADLIVCDSAILQALAAGSGVRLSLVKGSDLTAALLRRPLNAIDRIALVGGDPRAAEWLEKAQPGAEIFHHQPPHGLRSDAAARAAVAAFVERVDPQMTLIAVGAPQSEMIAALIKSRGRARGVALCIGASIEFLTGAKRRAPGWVQRLRLEWAFRLMSEPGRLWRRYLVDGPRIIPIWWRWRRSRKI